MTTKEPRQFNFREIASLDNTGVSLRNWVSKSSSFFLEFWDQATGFAGHLSVGKIMTESYDAALDQTTKDSNYCIADFENKFSSVWYASNDQIRVIIAEMLCMTEDETLGAGDDEFDELTKIELSMAQMFLEQLCSTLTYGWLGNTPITLTVGELQRDPKKTRLMRARDLVTRVDIDIKFSSRQTTIHWLLPKQQTSDLMDDCSETRKVRRDDEEPAKPSKEMISKVPVEVVVVIGETSVPMVELSGLKTGQLLKLDQHIDQPVVAYVNGDPYFECWPGRMGNSQSIEISKCLRADLAGGAR